jgi:hypothetical protein
MELVEYAVFSAQRKGSPFTSSNCARPDLYTLQLRKACSYRAVGCGNFCPDSTYSSWSNFVVEYGDEKKKSGKDKVGREGK